MPEVRPEISDKAIVQPDIDRPASIASSPDCRPEIGATSACGGSVGRHCLAAACAGGMHIGLAAKLWISDENSAPAAAR